MGQENGSVHVVLTNQHSDVAPNTEVHEKNLNSELEFYGTIQPANLLL
jgi:hypothetical protein